MALSYRLINLALRFASLGCRFVLIFLISRYLTIYDLGVFGLFNTTVALGAFFLGLEFHQYSLREIAAKPVDERASQFSQQLVLHAATYVLLLPVAAVIFSQGLLPREYFFQFLLVIVLEHLGLEQFRLLILLSRPLLANVVTFLRTASWVLVLVVAWFFDLDGAPSLGTVFDYWIAGALVALLLGAFFMHREKALVPQRLHIDVRVIATGARVAVPFFLAALAQRVMEFADRYVIDAFLGKEALGVYTFYSGIARVLMLGVTTMVSIIYYPRLLEFVNVNREQFDRYVHKMKRETVIFCAAFCALIVAGMPLALRAVDKPELSGYWLLLLTLLAAQVLMCMSFVPHYILYAHTRDRALLVTTATAAGASLVLNLVLVPTLGLIGSAVASLASMAALWALKASQARKVDWS